MFAQFFIVIAVAGYRVNRTEYVVKPVVEKGAVDSLRQGGLNVIDQVSHFHPSGTDIFFRGGFLEQYINDGLAGSGVALKIIEAGGVLQLFLQFVGYLFFNFFSTGARPGDRYHHLTDDEIGIFHSSQLLIRENASQKDHQHRKINKFFIAEGNFGQIEVFHRESPANRMVCPSFSLWTPAITICSSGSSPASTWTVLSPKAPNLTGRSETLFSRTTQIPGFWSD